MTSPPTTTQRFLLLDANVVIEAYRREVWEDLLDREALAVPSIVAHSEAFFYDSDLDAVPKPIHLPTLIQEGKIQELSATPSEMGAVAQIFDRVFLGGLHDGETEALALLHGGQFAPEFCSGDKMAIQALAMMGRSEDGISLESVLRRTGLNRSIGHEFTKKYFDRHLKIGQQKRITGEGLRS